MTDSDNNKTIAVVYLSYVPYGINFLKIFLVSYVHNNSGTSHELIILFNGFNDALHFSNRSNRKHSNQ